MIFKAMLIALTLSSETADIQTTRAAIQRGCVESNPLIGSAQPSTARLVLVKAPATLALVYVGHKLAAHHPRLAVLAVGAGAGATFGVAIRNTRCGR
jgi:hypothetical protein